jgi:hypothetical protein
MVKNRVFSKSTRHPVLKNSGKKARDFPAIVFRPKAVIPTPLPPFHAHLDNAPLSDSHATPGTKANAVGCIYNNCDIGQPPIPPNPEKTLLVVNIILNLLCIFD